MFGALIVAAGKGKRMANETPKQFMELGEKPVILHTLSNFTGIKDFFKKIVVVIPPGSMSFCRELFSGGNNCGISTFELVEGGDERQDSVYKGLLLLQKNDVKVICIHDGVRPFASAALIKKTAGAALQAGAVIPAIPLSDTLKEVNHKSEILQTAERERFRMAQTPQCFHKEIIMDAFEKAKEDGFRGTDDAALVERAGYKVLTVPGERTNIKLTTPDDFALAAIMIERGFFHV